MNDPRMYVIAQVVAMKAMKSAGKDSLKLSQREMKRMANGKEYIEVIGLKSGDLKFVIKEREVKADESSRGEDSGDTRGSGQESSAESSEPDTEPED
jgi:hypothetical protein